MTHLLIVILDDLTCMPDLLNAWRTIGVPGTTILESMGAYRVETWLTRVGLGNLDRLFEAKEQGVASIQDYLKKIQQS